MTIMLAASRNGTQAVSASATEVRQRTSGISGSSAGWSASTVSVRAALRRRSKTLHRSYSVRPRATASITAPTVMNRYFSASIDVLLSTRFHPVCFRAGRLRSEAGWGRTLREEEPNQATEQQFFQQEPARNAQQHGSDDTHNLSKQFHGVPPYWPAGMAAATEASGADGSAVFRATMLAAGVAGVSGAPKRAAVCSLRSPRISTLSPVRTCAKSCSRSVCAMRMQPCEAARPMDRGAFVP